MNRKFLTYLARLGVVLSLLGAWVMGASEAMAQMRPGMRQINRPAITQGALRQQQAKRAYVAGAVAQNRRERARDYYEGDRHHDRHDRYDRDDDDNGMGRVLIGVAVGAVVTGMVMKNRSETD